MKNKIIKFIFDSGFRSTTLIYYIQFLKKNNFNRLAKIVALICKESTGVEINLRVKIGNNLRIFHSNNIVLGGTSIIGDNVTIYNGVTLGVSGKLYINDNDKVMQLADYPTINNNCIIYPGAKILGDITIGENTIIGANSVVLHSIPPNSVAGGIPARFIKKNSFDLSNF